MKSNKAAMYRIPVGLGGCQRLRDGSRYSLQDANARKCRGRATWSSYGFMGIEHRRGASGALGSWRIGRSSRGTRSNVGEWFSFGYRQLGNCGSTPEDSSIVLMKSPRFASGCQEN